MWARVWEVRRQLVGVRPIGPPRGFPGSNSILRFGSKLVSRLSISLVLGRSAITGKPRSYWAERANDGLTQPLRPGRRPRNPQPAQTCGRGARPRRRTRPRQPRAASRAPEGPPPVTQTRGGTVQAPPHSRRLVGALSPRRGKLAGCVCVCMCVGVCFVIRSPADAAGMAACSAARRRGRGGAPGTPSYIRTRPTEAHVNARSPHAAHHAVRFSHARREPAAPRHTVYADVGLPTARRSPITAKRTFATRHNIGCYIYRAYL